uniref:Nucleolar 27S pre-rRNA processing Urb2/Npa2 C-terminal domain-containing protein n=1 Tax=Anopheles culicifacies TaxID=139723 RepID=A0A182LTI4_9DIPT
MDIKEKILERLSDAQRGFAGNIAYGIKLWKSPSFYYMSKYDITFNYFFDNVEQFVEELKDLDEAQFNERWQIINSFLLLPCPSNALPASVITRLEETLLHLSQQSLGRREQLLESFLIVAFDVKYKNFYKFDFQAYGSVLRVVLEYYKKCLNEPRPKEEEEKIVDRIFDDIKIYLKSLSTQRKWKTPFDSFVSPLSEVVLLLEKRGINRRNELLDFFQLVYFTDDNVTTYNRMKEDQNQQAFMGSFDTNQYPLHVIALLMEGFLRAYRDLKLEVLLFLKFFLQNVFVPESRSIVPDNHQKFAITKYVFTLLKKYFIIADQQLMVDFNFIEILSSKLKEQLGVCSASEPMMRDFLDLICTINHYNPLILEHSIVEIILKVMFIRKDPATLHSFQRMLISTVNMFVKLNKSENLCDELFMKLSDYLEETDLDDTILELRKKHSGKRKVDDGLSKTPSKKTKLADGSAQPAEAVSAIRDIFWDVLLSQPDTSNETGLIPHRAQFHNFWPGITFAWPDTDGQLGEAMKDYTKQLLTKRSLSYWKKFMLMLNDLMELPEQTVSSVFQMELALCWMCHFFAGNTLIEHSNLFWPRLVASIEEFDQILGNIGRRVLSGKDKEFTLLYGAFLNVVYYYGNYRLMVLYYRPDSIEESNYEKLRSYLKDSEWSMLERSVSEKDIPLLNRVLLQKLQLYWFTEQKGGVGEGQEENTSNHEDKQQIIGKILNDEIGENFRPVLLDRSTNVWFMGLLDKQQQRVVVHRLLDRAYCPLEEIKFILQEVSSNHELLEVFLLKVYKKIAELLSRSDKASKLGDLPFDELLDQDETDIVPRLKQFLEQSVSNVTENKIALKSSVVSGLEHLLDVLDEIRLDSFDQRKKSILVAAHLLLLANLNACNSEKIAERFKNQLIRFILLGTTTNMSKFITVDTLFQLFGLSPVVIILLQQLLEHLTEEKNEELKSILANFSYENDNHFELLLLIYNLERRIKYRDRKSTIPLEERKAFLDDIVTAVDGYLLQKDAKKLRKNDMITFNHAIKGCLTSIRHKAERQEELTEQLQEHFLAYIKQAMKVFTYNSDMLLTRCLVHKDYLKLDATLIGAIEQKCWDTFLSLMQEQIAVKEDYEQGMALDEENPAVSKTDEQMRRIETIITSLVSHLSEEQYMEKLNLLNRVDFTSGKDASASLKITIAVFNILSKKGLTTTISKETCKVFVRSFAAVVARDVMGLCVLNQHQRNQDLVETILECFATIIANRKLALFPALLDYVLQFLSAINICKQAFVQQGDEIAFFRMHRLMGNVMYWLLQARPNYVASRLPSYMHAYEGLLAALICYKGDVGLGKGLNSFEILTISDLLLPLQRIVNIACKKLEKQLYILAPYVLGKILNTIVQCKRATTEHNRIANNVYNVCFSLMAIYDSHAPAYLLRTLDESCRILFTTIKKRYERRKENIGYKARYESTLKIVADQMLLEQFPLRVCHLTLGAQEQQTPVEGRPHLDFARFWTGFTLLRWFLLLLPLLLVGGRVSSRSGSSISGTSGGRGSRSCLYTSARLVTTKARCLWLTVLLLGLLPRMAQNARDGL